MEKLICKECGEIFEYEKLGSCRAQLRRHLISEHKMSIVDYIVKHEYNGIHPLCPCGCGKKLNLKSKSWTFNKYFSDTCYGNLVKACNEEVRKQYFDTHKKDFDIVKYYETRYDRKTFEEAFLLLNTNEFTLADIAKTYNIDKRTLKKVWLAMKITTQEELKERLEYNKYKLSHVHNTSYFQNNENVLSWVYSMIKTKPGKYTIHNLIKLYNKTFPEKPCGKSDNALAKSLLDVYGEEVDMLLATGYHSSEEYNFFIILNNYFSKYKIKLGKRFVLDNTYVYYDFMIGNKLLIEYDSVGKFHTDEYEITQDIKKENFAIENGYHFLRLTKSDTLKIETLLNIKNILENEIN